METIQPKKKKKEEEKKKKRAKQKTKKQLENEVKIAKNKHLTINTLNVNRLNAVIKRHRVADWIRKAKTSNLLSTRDSP